MVNESKFSAPAATVERRDGVAVITLNRPHVLNAVNSELSGLVGAALEQLDSDPGMHVGVITGAGRAFCSGADLKELASGRSVRAPGHEEWGFAGLVEHPIRKPLIAAVNGYALGGGTEVVLACDLAVLGESASLGFPEITRGLFAAAGGLIHMPRQIPMKIAMEAALTGEPIASDDALRWGLVNRVVPKDEVLSTALELASAIAAQAPLSVRASKRIVTGALGRGSAWDQDVWRGQDEEFAVIRSSADAQEGTAAFAERRTPNWTGS